jgi:predicted TIM-barrel fold metal-dependent hydrolase
MATRLTMGLSLVDVHTHAFPDESSGKLWQESVGVPDSKRSGYIGELGLLMEAGHIEHAVILMLYRAREAYESLIGDGKSDHAAQAEVMSQISAYNRWGCATAKRDPRFLPFIGVNARFMSPAHIRNEIVELKEAGAVGVKITPSSMDVYANDALLHPIFEACIEASLPLLSQSGRGGGHAPSPGADPFGRPKYWAEALERYPRLTVILAHLGSGYEDEIAELTHSFPNIYTDTSLRLSGLGKPDRWTADQLVATIRRIGVDRVLFGSNYPFVNPAVYATILEQLPLTDSERRQVAAKNFELLMANVGFETFYV